MEAATATKPTFEEHCIRPRVLRTLQTCNVLSFLSRYSSVFSVCSVFQIAGHTILLERRAIPSPKTPMTPNPPGPGTAVTSKSN